MRRNYTHHQNFQNNHWRERYVRDEELIENLVRRLLRNLKKGEGGKNPAVSKLYMPTVGELKEKQFA